jgi:hypothetical protein
MDHSYYFYREEEADGDFGMVSANDLVEAVALVRARLVDLGMQAPGTCVKVTFYEFCPPARIAGHERAGIWSGEGGQTFLVMT